MSARDEVQDRIRGLYGIADAGATADPVALGAAMLEGGCRLVQLRCKTWADDEVLRACRELLPRCLAVGATLIVNDLAEVAVAAGAHGVHVGQTDDPAAEVRRILGPDLILGRSTNAPDQVGAALRGADYVAFGPMYETRHLSRPKQIQGPALLRAVRPLVPAGVPLVAIGGITRERLPEIRDGGADAWAVIGAIALAPDPIEATRALS